MSSGHLTGDLPAGGETDLSRWVELIKGGFQLLESVFTISRLSVLLSPWSLLQSSSSLLAQSVPDLSSPLRC